MNCKEAIIELKRCRLFGTDEKSVRRADAVDMAIVALQLQDGNLHLDSVGRGFNIGTVNGNVYT